MSDTHGQHGKVTIPDGDVLVFAGDLMTDGYRYSEILRFGDWFSSLPHKNKILIAGNHDHLFEIFKQDCLEYFQDVDYLENSGVVLGGMKFWGSPVTLEFNNWAFNVSPARIGQYWDAIPTDTDVLITHGPPQGIRDSMVWKGKAQSLGCPQLRLAVERIQPKAHIFGHIHSGYGHMHSLPRPLGGTHFYNVSVCNEEYRAVNPVTAIDL